MSDKYTPLTQEQLAAHMGTTPEKLKTFSEYIQSDEWKSISAQRMQEHMVQSFTPTKMPNIIPYAKLQLEEQQEFAKIFEAYQRESIRVLQAIEQNTANLYTLVDLVSKGNEQQDKLIEIITDILSIAKAKTKEEAESKFRKVMDKITKTVEDAETLGKIAGFATTVWNLAQPIIEKLPQIGG